MERVKLVRPPSKPLKGGDQVCDRTIPTRRGIIITAGPEVSEVKWDNGQRDFESNIHLIPVTTP